MINLNYDDYLLLSDATKDIKNKIHHKIAEIFLIKKVNQVLKIVYKILNLRIKNINIL